jgi:Protein of unknown function (DUF2852)
MTIASRVDDFGRPAWIGLMVLSFIFWWPLGLAMLGFLIGSGRMTCWTDHSARRWQRRMERMQAKAGPWFGGPDWGQRGRWSGGWRSSGNSAFDEYRAETLRRLEEEQREFVEFLERLRHAKDKAEFDQFMADRGHRPQPQPGV